MDTDSDTDTDSAMVSITARGLLMLRPIPTFSTVDSDTPDMDWDTSDMPDTISDTDTDSAMVSITASRLPRSFSEPTRTKMDCYQFELPFTSATVSVLPY